MSLASQHCIASLGFATFHIYPATPASFLTLLFAAFACGCRTRCVKFGHRIRGPLFRWLRFASQHWHAMMVFRFLDRLLRKTASYRCERHHAISSRCLTSCMVFSPESGHHIDERCLGWFLMCMSIHLPVVDWLEALMKMSHDNCKPDGNLSEPQFPKNWRAINIIL